MIFTLQRHNDNEMRHLKDDENIEKRIYVYIIEQSIKSLFTEFLSYKTISGHKEEQQTKFP